MFLNPLLPFPFYCRPKTLCKGERALGRTFRRVNNNVAQRCVDGLFTIFSSTTRIVQRIIDTSSPEHTRNTVWLTEHVQSYASTRSASESMNAEDSYSPLGCQSYAGISHPELEQEQIPIRHRSPDLNQIFRFDRILICGGDHQLSFQPFSRVPWV